MKYIGSPDFKHGTPEKMGVLLINLGTPDAPDTKAVRRYLAEFLSDPRIIELPTLLRSALLHGVILRVRPAKSAKAYREVWSNHDGSPLLSNSVKQTAALQQILQKKLGADAVIVELGMRYGNPSIDHALEKLAATNVRRLIILPIYPQYSATTTASAFDAVTNRLQRTRWIPEIRFINQYCDDHRYINALANSVRRSWRENGRGDLLITSYHGLPKRFLTEGDPYYCQCHKTSRLLAVELGISSDKIRVVFQSRVGKQEWLRPYCDETMKSLPGEGFKSIDVISPAFSADCLETLEEIEGENREYFMNNGGEQFHYIKCLNDHPQHIQFLGELIEQHAQGWPETDSERDRILLESQCNAQAQRAKELKKATLQQ